MFNRVSLEAEGLMKAALGEHWLKALGEIFPQKRKRRHCYFRRTRSPTAIAQLMLAILRQDTVGLTKINQAMET